MCDIISSNNYCYCSKPKTRIYQYFGIRVVKHNIYLLTNGVTEKRNKYR